MYAGCFDHATVDRQSTACVGSDTGQCCSCTSTHGTAQGGGTRGVDGQVVCAVNRVGEADGVAICAGEHRVCTQAHGFAVALCARGLHHAAIDSQGAANVCGEAGQCSACTSAYCATQGGGTSGVDGQAVWAVNRGGETDGTTRCAGEYRVCTQAHRFAEALCAGGLHHATVDHQSATCVGREAGQCSACARANCTTQGGRTCCVDGQAVRTVNRMGEANGVT